MKHNPTIHALGVWWLIETDRDGNRWAVHDLVRLPYGQGQSILQAIDSVKR